MTVTAHRTALTGFTVGATLVLNHRQYLTSLPGDDHTLVDLGPLPFAEAGEFRVGLHDVVDTAWVQWEDYSALRARVTALSCIYCHTPTTRRCCMFALCHAHHDHHQAVEHAAPDGGRYQAALTIPDDVLNPRYGPTPEPIPGLSYPRDRSFSLERTARDKDTLRAVEHVRHTTINPGGSDPLGDALHQLVTAGRRLPPSGRFSFVVADILARCTWAAIAEAVGDHDGAQWMRHQPQIVSTKPTALTRHVDALDASVFGLRTIPTRTGPGEMAASDALGDLWPFVAEIPTGALGFSQGVAAEIMSHALTQPGGPERVGKAVARAQQDAIATVLASIGARRT